MDWNLNILFVISLTTNALLVRGYAGCSSAYGSTPCSFVPAPPGKTPPCARPGLTFCEHPDHYPGQLINYLIQQWRFDHATLIASESRDEFASYFRPPPPPVYGPPNHPAYPPEPIHIPRPLLPFHEGQRQAYLPQNATEGVLDLRYTGGLPAFGRQYQPQGYYAQGEGQFGPYGGDVWRRRIEGNYQRLRRSLRRQRAHRSPRAVTQVEKSSNTTLSRTKRQGESVETLCRVRSQFIAPRAALNNKGNWMYVVNMPEVDSSYAQLVKSEICASQTCNGICSLPQGYSSRCEQKYVQKRLVALEAGGSQLYNDVFWFPSCCVCTISRS